MKKLVLTTLITCALAGSVLAQGTVSLQANTVHGRISYSTDGTATTLVPVGNPASVGTYGNLNVAVYWASSGTVSPFTSTSASLLGTAWTKSQNVLRQISTSAGWTALTTFTLPGLDAAAPGAVSAMVVGWTGTYLDWNSAYTANEAGGLFGWTGSALSTGARQWNQNTAATSPPGTAIALTYGAGGFNGLALQSLAPIPEPGTFALAGLGLATLLIFRRRK